MIEGEQYRWRCDNTHYRGIFVKMENPIVALFKEVEIRSRNVFDKAYDEARVPITSTIILK